MRILRLKIIIDDVILSTNCISLRNYNIDYVMRVFDNEGISIGFCFNKPSRTLQLVPNYIIRGENIYINYYSVSENRDITLKELLK